MKNTKESELRPSFRRSAMSAIKGTRTRHVVTLSPNKVNPGEELYIDIPMLSSESCLVPGSLHLLFNFKNSNTKSWFNNNLSKLLCERLQIKLAGETVYDNSGESHLAVYKDLWRTKTDRKQSPEYGIANENLRKLISKDDSGANSGDAGRVNDGLMFSVFGTKQRLRVGGGKILDSHGLYAPFYMNNNFQYILTLPSASSIMTAQGGESVDTYSLENLELEYETILNTDLALEVSGAYSTGRSLSYEHATLMKTSEWDKALTLVNENVNLPRKSMKAIVLLFTKKSGRVGSEEYLYPNIEKVKVTIEGNPNMLYSQGIPKSRLYDEAKRVFNKVPDSDRFITPQSFYKTHFALVVDLRSIEDNMKYATGKRIINTQSGVLLEITKLATAEDVTCRVYVLSDGLVNFINNDISSIQY